MQIGAVVVTCNRLALLKECVAALRGQQRPLDRLFVVNNGSTDGTHDWVKDQPDIIEITQENTGSSGGQTAGILAALQAGCDWLWLMDDDTIPDADALAGLVRFSLFENGGLGFLCSHVRWTDGSTHLMNRPELLNDYTLVKAAFDLGALPVSSASFVSVLVSRVAIERCGLPLREMFIWGDDVEFTRRISRQFPSYAIPSSRVLHKTPRNYFADLLAPEPADFGKLRFGMRNYIYNEIRWRRGLKSRISLVLLSLKIAVACWKNLPPGQALTLCQSLFSGYFFSPRVVFPSAI